MLCIKNVLSIITSPSVHTFIEEVGTHMHDTETVPSSSLLYKASPLLLFPFFLGSRVSISAASAKVRGFPQIEHKGEKI